MLNKTEVKERFNSFCELYPDSDLIETLEGAQTESELIDRLHDAYIVQWELDQANEHFGLCAEFISPIENYEGRLICQ